MATFVLEKLLAPYLHRLEDLVGSAWNPLRSLERSALLTLNPEIELRDVPVPQALMKLVRLPFVFDHSKISSLKLKFGWGTFFGK